MTKTMMILMLLAGLSFAGSNDSTATQVDSVKMASLVVKMVNMDNDKGQVMIALCDSKESFEDEQSALRGVRAIVKNGKASFTFENIPFGEYAVKVIHDEDLENDLDTNWMGIPTEAFGFSNDARARFGPPDYEDAMFKVDKPEVTITITLMRI